MSRFSLLFVGLFALALCVGVGGCKKADKDEQKDEAEKDHKDHKDEGHEDHKDDDDKAAAAAKIKAGLAMLSDDDRALAETQGTCLVMAKSQLGSMGKPIKVTNGDKAGFLCCKGCQAKFDAEPEKYLAKE